MPITIDLGGIALTPREADLKARMQQLASGAFAEHAARVDAQAVFPAESIAALRAGGLLNASVPVEHGGLGASILATAVMVEEAARACGSTAMVLAMHYSLLPVIFAKAGPSQAPAVARLARGEALGAIAASEVGSGTRLWHVDGFACERGDGVVELEASKSFVTAASAADYFVVPVRSTPTSSSDDLDLYLVPADTPGVERVGTWDAMGLRGNDSRPVRFSKTRVPLSHRLGEQGDGFGYLLAYNLPHYLVALSAAYLGIAQAAMDFAVSHARGRTHTDTTRSLATVETIQRYVGTIKGLIDQMRCSLYRSARLVDRSIPVFHELVGAGILHKTLRRRQNDPFFAELLAMKASTCEGARQVVDIAMQVCGGRGYKRGTAVERAYRDVRAGSVMAPSDDVAKLVAGRQILGVPQPWA